MWRSTPGTDGIDMTVYWLPSTDADYLRSLRHLAYRNRVEIYSIGTRVQLAQPTPDLREKQLADLRKWVEVAQRVGATHIRVFGGQKPAGATLEQAVGFAAETLKRGAEIAGAAASCSASKTTEASPTSPRRRSRSSGAPTPRMPGMNLDTGNFRPPKVYDQIEMSIPHAVSTHIKTEVANDDGKTRSPADWDRIFKMFAAHGLPRLHGTGIRGRRRSGDDDPRTAAPAERHGEEILGVSCIPMRPDQTSRRRTHRLGDGRHRLHVAKLAGQPPVASRRAEASRANRRCSHQTRR